jgi:IS1 family transposase
MHLLYFARIPSVAQEGKWTKEILSSMNASVLVIGAKPVGRALVLIKEPWLLRFVSRSVWFSLWSRFWLMAVQFRPLCRHLVSMSEPSRPGEIEQEGKLDMLHVQADEIRVKGRSQVIWMGLAIMVSTRLWLAGVVSPTRDRQLADQLLQQVRRCACGVQALLVATDGWAAYVNSIKRAFREKVKETAGKGRASLQVWKDLCIVTIIKHTRKKRVVEVTRTVSYGEAEQANGLLSRSQGGSVWNTAFIERFNGTLRERLAVLTRKCRHAASCLQALETGMYLVGCAYHFGFPHQELSKEKHLGHPVSPAMAAGLTDHLWSFRELLRFRVAPPPWVAPERRGRPRKHAQAQACKPRKALLRLRKGIFCATPV